MVLAFLSHSGFRPKRLYLPGLGHIHDPREVSSTFNEIFVDKVYQPIKPLPPNCLIVDIGSHYGLFAIYAMLRLNVAEIRCFEPNPFSFKILSANIAATNNPGTKVNLYPHAVAETNGFVQMLLPENNLTSIGSAIIPDGVTAIDRRICRVIRVPAISIAEAIRNECDLLKLDAEGIEYDVLRNSVITPARVREVAVEVHEVNRQPQRFRELIQSLIERGYSVFGSNRKALSMKDTQDMLQCDKINNTVLHFA